MGNTLADKAAGAADLATDSQDRTGLLSYFANKQIAYSKLIAAIMRRIVRVTAHTRDFRKAEADKRGKDSDSKFVFTPAVPKFAALEDTVTLKLVDPPPLSGGSQQQHSQLRLRIFWTTIYVCPIVDSNVEHGITWLQLIAVYLLNSGCNEAAFTHGLIGARPKLAPLLKQFISESKTLFSTR